jgi:hypothetical protein
MGLFSDVIYFKHMSSPIRLDRDKIKKLVYGIHSLNEGQRALIKEALEKLAHSADGHISTEELSKELHHLRESHSISETDAASITRAVFP